MTAPRLEVVVDVAEPRVGCASLFPASGEFARAWKCLGERGVRLPFAIVLELYAYEFLERTRDPALQGTTVHAPFWPPLLCAAADVVTVPTEALLARGPELVVRFHEREAVAVKDAAVRLFACLPFDPELYVQLVTRAVRGERP